MAQLNWSMTMVGYPAHARSASRTTGVTHMSTHEALQFIESLGLSEGWLQIEGSQPQLERIRSGTRIGVNLPELFASSRVINTEGVSSGALTFVAVDPARGKPPADRTLIAWAEANQAPWLEIIDNDVVYLGGLDDQQVDRLMVWFLCRRPLEIDWRTTHLEARAAGRLRHGLFEHGWTRNLGLVKTLRRQSCELWGGVHRKCILDHAAQPSPTQVQVGIRMSIEGKEWIGKDLGEQRCLLSDETGKLQFGSGFYQP
jgi:hypothetical protein